MRHTIKRPAFSNGRKGSRPRTLFVLDRLRALLFTFPFCLPPQPHNRNISMMLSLVSLSFSTMSQDLSLNFYQQEDASCLPLGMQAPVETAVCHDKYCEILCPKSFHNFQPSGLSLATDKLLQTEQPGSDFHICLPAFYIRFST